MKKSSDENNSWNCSLSRIDRDLADRHPADSGRDLSGAGGKTKPPEGRDDWLTDQALHSTSIRLCFRRFAGCMVQV